MIQMSKQFELVYLSSLPALLTLLLAIFSMASKHLEGFDHFMPWLPIIPVFYWGIAQTRDMPYWFLFLLGLINDSVTGLPLGVSSLMYLLFVILLHTQRKYIYKEGFVIKWGFFTAILAATNLINWLTLSFYYSHAQVVVPVILQWLMTVGCYPILHKICDALYSHVHGRRWQILHGRH